MSDSPSTLPARLHELVHQMRALVEMSPGRGTPRRARETALSLLSQMEARIAQVAGVVERVRELEAEVESRRAELREALKLIELQEADLDRYKAECEARRPNQPERVPESEIELALARVLQSFGEPLAANDARVLGAPEPGHAPVAEDASGPELSQEPAENKALPEKPKRSRSTSRHAHGRRRLDVSNLPVHTIEIDPDEVVAAGGVGFRLIGDEVSERVAYRPGNFLRIRFVRRKWVRIDEEAGTPPPAAATMEQKAPSMLEAESLPKTPPVCTAPLPDCVWPGFMADPSAIAQGIVAKYDDSLPLARQERISARQGFNLPRSTQCGWFGAAYDVGYRIVEAMFDEARSSAFCIATDATSVRVRAEGGGPCETWHVFVFIADKDHVIFRYADEHSSATVESFLNGFGGYLLADAAPIYDVLYRDYPIIEVACWFHARRYFWRALESDRERAMEALALIGKLFEIERACRDLPMPERTEVRAQAAKPVLALLDSWIERHKDLVDPRGPLDRAIGYYENQRDALRRFLDDGRLRLDNNISEGALRYVVLGRHNWPWFANETGLRWYTTFRSLIASCGLHGLNPQEYLEEVLRLAPHWPVTRMLELAPKYWPSTRARLNAHQRAILARPWELELARVSGAQALASPTIGAAA